MRSVKTPNDWVGLNSVVMKWNEEMCVTLLKAESEGKRRIGFLLRIHSRLNKLRAHRERAELRKIAR